MSSRTACDPVVVRDPRVASDPKPVINHAAEMLDKMPVQIGLMTGPGCQALFDFDIAARTML